MNVVGSIIIPHPSVSTEPDNPRERLDLLGVTAHGIQEEMIRAHCDQLFHPLTHLLRLKWGRVQV
jgi:hypothetical protein